MLIPVLDKNKKPLMPTSPVRARMLLKRGAAKPYRNKLGIFCIILQREVTPNNQQIVVGIDPGSKFEGWSVVGTKQTILNGTSGAPYWVKDAVEVRRNMRRRRRGDIRRRPCRIEFRNKNKTTLPPSTYARWNAKIRILVLLQKILPITDVVVEDVRADTMPKPNKRWNRNFSAIEQGKKWFYRRIPELGLKLHTMQGYDTSTRRKRLGLKKVSNKAEQSFYAHAVDAWTLAASITGATQPTETGLFYWTPLRWHRRQLHRLEPDVGGVRSPYGGTRSMCITRGTLVRHPKHGLTYVGGQDPEKGRVSLHSTATGKRLTQSAKPSDLHILTTVHWRAQFLPSPKGEGSPCASTL